MITLHILFNISVHEECRTPEYEAVHERFERLVDTLSSETLVLLCYAIDPAALWDLQEHRQSHDDFFKKRSKPSGLQVPRLFEAAISLTLAERYRSLGDIEQCRTLLSFAVSNHPGHAGLLAVEKTFTGNEPLDWRKIMIPKASTAQPDSGQAELEGNETTKV
ncbi:hypothetical protein DT385_09390 [Pseudomonas syringae]|nr:hypothetical protein DT385_09390 [Pseudomonas syringae]